MSAERTAARAREALVLLSMLFVFTWTIGYVAAWGSYSDFVQFYILGHVAREGAFDALTSNDAFLAQQLRLLPATWTTPFPAVYPPQIALLMRPFALLSYWPAFAVFMPLSVVTCLFTTWRMAATQPRLAQWPRHVLMATAASPILWTLVVQGQISALALMCLFVAWVALRNDRPGLAGAALGVLAYKAPLVVPAMAVCLLAGEWTMVAGGLTAAVAQYALPIPWGGWETVTAYLAHLLRLAQAPDALAQNLVLMHSWRTFWTAITPASVAPIAYAITAGATVIGTAWVWRRLHDPLHRVAVLGAAIVLASPHLYAYDLVLLIPLVVASADLALAQPHSRFLWTLLWAGYFAPMWSIPVAFLNVQGSTPVLAAWLVEFSRVALSAGRDFSPAARPALDRGVVLHRDPSPG